SIRAQVFDCPAPRRCSDTFINNHEIQIGTCETPLALADRCSLLGYT
ncbi:MAG: hypothetical protein ACI944_000636, partial [Natronomonas sp.]